MNQKANQTVETTPARAAVVWSPLFQSVTTSQSLAVASHL